MSEPSCAASFPDVSLSCAPVAQLDRANASGALGREFEPLRAHHSRSFPSLSSKIRNDHHEPWWPAVVARRPAATLQPAVPIRETARWQDKRATRLQATTLTFTGNDLAPASPLNIVFRSSITFSSEVVAVRPAGRSSFGEIAHPLALAPLSRFGTTLLSAVGPA